MKGIEMACIPPPRRSQMEVIAPTNSVLFLVLIVATIVAIVMAVVMVVESEERETKTIVGQFERAEYIPDGGFGGGPAKTVIYLTDGRTVVLRGHRNVRWKHNQKIRFKVPK